MTVYVDDFMFPYHGMLMSHLVADTDEELHAMADKIGVQRRWWQCPPKHDSHYDIAKAKRTLAISYGAVPVTYRQLALMNSNRRKTGSLGLPDPRYANKEGDLI